MPWPYLAKSASMRASRHSSPSPRSSFRRCDVCGDIPLLVAHHAHRPRKTPRRWCGCRCTGQGSLAPVWEKSMMENGKMEKSIMMDSPRVMEKMDSARQSIICLGPPLAAKTRTTTSPGSALCLTGRPSAHTTRLEPLVWVRTVGSVRQADRLHRRDGRLREHRCHDAPRGRARVGPATQ